METRGWTCFPSAAPRTVAGARRRSSTFIRTRPKRCLLSGKRAAQLFSKSRFIAAQFDAYFDNDLWLDLARHANSMADGLRGGIGASNSARLAWPTASNEVFAVVTKSAARTAENRGATFYEWPIPAATPDLVDDNETLIRLVTSFATTKADVDGFLKCLAA